MRGPHGNRGPRFLSDAFSDRILPGIIPIEGSPPSNVLGRRIVAAHRNRRLRTHRTMAVAVLVPLTFGYPSASLPRRLTAR